MKAWNLMLTLLLIATCTACGLAKPTGPSYTDPEQAPIDFELQGEYQGEVPNDYGAMGPYGGQIIALGDGKFRGVGYPGGLPGDGWNEQERVLADGELEDGVVKFSTPDGGRVAKLEDGVITVYSPDGQAVGELKKVHRESPTLGQEPPEGAVVLFDGTSADAFHNGRMTDDGLLKQGVTSKQKFGAHKIHFEFRTPFEPESRGQGRGNSGCYVQGRYEVQILDSFGLSGEHNECGGIYKVSKPKVNMCYPPLSWQTYDIELTPAEFEGDKKVADARLTVRHNGVLIQDDVAVPGPTAGAPVNDNGQGPGPVFLQDHSNPVRFRNIWVVPTD